MRDYRYDHVHLRSADPDAMGRFFETMFGAEVKRDIYPPGTLYPGQMRVSMKRGWAEGAGRAGTSARSDGRRAVISVLRGGAYRADGG